MAQRILPANPQAPSRARQFLAENLTAWGQRDLLAEAILALSELVTNAFLHGQGDITVRVTLTGVLRVAVYDSGPGQPAIRQYSSTATTGRGLHLVDSLSDRWGAIAEGPGKWVWFEQDLASTRPGPPDHGGGPGGDGGGPLRPTGPTEPSGTAKLRWKVA
ncbi:MAG: ATP-binding protein [Actinomycetota bacterium]